MSEHDESVIGYLLTRVRKLEAENDRLMAINVANQTKATPFADFVRAREENPIFQTCSRCKHVTAKWPNDLCSRCVEEIGVGVMNLRPDKAADDKPIDWGNRPHSHVTTDGRECGDSVGKVEPKWTDLR